MFLIFPNCMMKMMCLPHSSAECERQFSLLKIIKTPLRNKLCPESLSVLMHVHRYVKNSQFHLWDIPDSIIKKNFTSDLWKETKNANCYLALLIFPGLILSFKRIHGFISQSLFYN